MKSAQKLKRLSLTHGGTQACLRKTEAQTNKTVIEALPCVHNVNKKIKKIKKTGRKKNTEILAEQKAERSGEPTEKRQIFLLHAS